MKYVDIEPLIKEIDSLYDKWCGSSTGLEVAEEGASIDAAKSIFEEVRKTIDSLQQDEKAVELEMCSQSYWEERGWMMIPPDVTLKGIESLLEQVRKKLQQEQAEGLHFTPLNRLIQKIPSENWNDTVNNYAKKLRDCLIQEGYRKDAEVLQGYEQAEQDIITLIESRIGEILGDAQPAPVLRAELRELIDKIKEI